MVVVLATIELEVPASTSLKDKRQAIRSVVARVRNEFNVSVAEVDHLGSWKLATLAVACVSKDASYAQGLLERVVRFVERAHTGLVLLDYRTEML